MPDTITTYIEDDVDGPYHVAEHADYPGAIGTGATEAEAREDLAAAIVAWKYTHARRNA